MCINMLIFGTQSRYLTYNLSSIFFIDRKYLILQRQNLLPPRSSLSYRSIFVVKKFRRAIPLRFMQIFTSIEQFDDLKNMLVEKVFVRLKVHEETIFCYEDKKKKKHFLLTYVEWLAQMKRNDVVDSSFSSTRGCGSHNEKKKRSWVWSQTWMWTWWQRRL